MTAPLCGCHAEAMTWQRDVRRRDGGYWVCRAERREYNQRRARERAAWERDKYANDSVFRVNRLVRESVRRRAASLARKHGQQPPNPRMAEFLKAVRPKGG